MTPKQFIEKFYPYAIESEKKTGIPATATMAQAALESGWGKSAIGNNVFGIKYKSSDKKYVEVLTTEHSKSPYAFKGAKTKSITYDRKKEIYIYKIWQYFADYDSPAEAFKEHSRLLLTDRYKHALRWKYSPVRYLIAIWKAGYATDVNYGDKMEAMVQSVKKRLPAIVVEILSEIKSIPLGRIAKEPPIKIKDLKFKKKKQ